MGEHLAHRGGSRNQSSMSSSGPLEASSSSSSAERQTASFTIDSILGRPCSNAAELCEGVEGPHVPSGALSSPPSASKAGQVDTNTYSTIYPRLGYPDSKDSISLKSSLDSAFNLQWDDRKAKSHLPFSQSPSNKKSSLIGRSPRVPFTRNQVEGLEAKFRLTNYLSSREVTMLANQLQVTEARVKIWFQNRRARQRREAFVREIEQTTRHRPQCDQLNASASQSVVLNADQTSQNPLPPDIPFLESDLLQLASTASRGVFGDAFTQSPYAIQDLSHLHQPNFHETWF
ncbi:unnamed protein product [Taenia asiatica]|uniref:Homeobox domain-containing protein n=1 Tax=Taenia asiatica TaxID=60517 RepID=A0A0R3VTJ4_TAEAS|nr:unnamed protein product [Taenia asiatica]